jgi:5,10-methenyltetrahydrofolate synthetase
LRQRLIAERQAMPPEAIAVASGAIAAQLDALLPDPHGLSFAFYWPMAGEPDVRALAEAWVRAGAQAALPETAKGQPLTFRPWTPGCAMRPGVWQIPVPDTMAEAHPAILLIPCLGHDRAGYRLGHGGGFYDRTLAHLAPKPLAVGVGYQAAQVASIGPEPHDIPMDMIVTDQGAVDFRGRRRV